MFDCLFWLNHWFKFCRVNFEYDNKMYTLKFMKTIPLWRFFNLNKVLLIWWRCVTPLRALIIIIFLLENDMRGLGCYTSIQVI